MNEPSDGVAEELERQLQLALAAAAIAARRATAARQHRLEQAQRDSAQNAQAVKAQIDAERRLAAAHVQPVFDSGWWETATPGESPTCGSRPTAGATPIATRPPRPSLTTPPPESARK